MPKRWDPRADTLDPTELSLSLDRLRAGIAATAEQMPDHAEFIVRRNAQIAIPQ